MLNPKIKTLNSKQAQMSKTQNSKLRHLENRSDDYLWILYFGFV
jgi:hypothetical protein